MISIPSFSKEEKEVADHIDNFLRERGISTNRLLNNIYACNKYFDPNKQTILLNSHHDTVKPNSYSAVYYINDSDGDTFLFNEVVTDETVLPERLTVAVRITPKKNRLLIFESNRYHASSNPRISDSRFVINTIFVPVEKETQ